MAVLSETAEPLHEVAARRLTRARVCHLTSVHPSDDIRIFHKECLSLVSAGYEVSLVAPGHHVDDVQGVRLVGVPPPGDRLARMTLTALRVLRAALQADAAIYQFHDPELLPVGLLLRAMGKRVIYDVHEDVPASVFQKDYLPRPVRRALAPLLDHFERTAARCLSQVVAATPAIARRFPASRTTLVQNYPLTGEFADASEVPYDERPPVAAFVGGISELRGAAEMLTVAGQLGPTLGLRVQLVGRFESPALEARLRAMDGWPWVDAPGQCTRAQVGQVFARARVGLLLFHPVPNHLAAQPNKLFEYMAAGLPVVASDFPLWRQLVERIGCGVLVDPLDPAAIADAVEWLLSHPAEASSMGTRGRRAIQEELNWPVEERKLFACYERLLHAS